MLEFLAMLLGLQLFQIYLYDITEYFSLFLSPEMLAVFALLTFAAVLGLVRLPRRQAIIVGGMALVRLGAQFCAPPLRLILATLGVMLWMWFISGSLYRLRVFPLAVFADIVLRSVFWYDQMAFHSQWWALLICILITGSTFYFVYREIRKQTPRPAAPSEPSFSRLLPFAGLGVTLYLMMFYLPNPSRLLLSLPGLWSYIFILLLLGAGSALLFIAIPGRRITAILSGLVLIVALRALSTELSPAWLWFALSAISAWILTGIILIRPAPKEISGSWRGGLVTFLAFLILLVVYFLVQQMAVTILVTISGVILAAAGIFAAWTDPAPAPALPLRTRQAAGTILATGIAGVIAWVALNQPVRTDGLALTPVFLNGREGYTCFRIPSIVRAPDGSLLAFAEGRRDNCGDHGGVIRIVMKRSTDNGLTWSPLAVVAENGDHVAASPSPVVDEQTGEVILIFNKTSFSEFDVAAGKGARLVFLTRSPDNGLTWSQPVDITDQVLLKDADWRQVVPAVGHAIQLRSGRIFYSAHVTVGNNNVYHSQNYVFWSDDHGQSWTIGGINPALGYNESMAVELEDGSVMVNIRAYAKNTSVGFRAVARYPFDAKGNITLAPGYYDRQLITPTVASSIIRYGWQKDGQGILLFSGPDHPRQRVNMTVRLSRDDGQTWQAARTIDPGPSSYSDLTVQSDGLVGLLYERGNEGGIWYTSFSTGWLEE